MLSYLKIIRPLNLLIILLTQGLFRFCVIEPFFSLGASNSALSYFEFGLLVISTLLIAAGGYVINDYYDVEIDHINKPSKTFAREFISMKNLRAFYFILTIAGIVSGFWLAFRMNNVVLGFIFPVVAIMLWYYSSKYQKTMLVGNFMISLLSGLVLLIVWIFEIFALLNDPHKYVEVMSQIIPVGWIALSYTFFAILVSFVREILKDTEDIKGDNDFGYRTFPIIFGWKIARNTATGFSLLVIALLAVFQYFLYVNGFTLVFWYLLIAVQTLLLYLVFHITSAKSKEDFHFLSNVTKIIMLAGILSMQLFYISV